MKKGLKIGIMSTLITTLLIGCSSTQSTTGDSSKAVSVKWMISESSVQPMQSNVPSLKLFKEKTNVDIALELVPSSSYTEKKTSLIATNNISDIIRVTSKEVQTFARSGIFLNLSEYEEHMPNFLKLVEDRPELKKIMVDGKLYSFPLLEHFRISVAPQPMLRVDLLEKHNLEKPETWDELYTVLKELKQIYPDSHPFTTRQKTLGTINLLSFPLGSGGGGTMPLYYEPKEEKYVYGPAHENFIEVITFMNKIYKDGILDPDYSVNTQDMVWEKLSSGKSFFYYDNNTFAARVFNPALKQIDANARIEMIDPLENAFGETRSHRYQRDWLENSNYAISSKVSNPEAIVKMFDYFYSEEGTMLTNFGVEGEHYNMVDGVAMPTQALQDKVKDKPGDQAAMMRAEVGLGQFALAVNIDETWDMISTDPYMIAMGEKINELTEKGEIIYQTMDPPFTDEEMEELKKLENKVNAYYASEIDKFIMGTRPLSEFQEFQAKLKTDGANQMEKIYNQALARIQ